jgi:NAD(P)-dependent dehydrogenase (short-subunit alcohol dehydrogenase family)
VTRRVSHGAPIPGHSGMTSRNRTVVITGANAGIGFATAIGLAKQGATIVLICRSAERGRAAVKAVVGRGASGAKLVIADLSSQAAIRELSASLHEQLPRIDVLINNVGAAFAHRELTVDGLEKTFALNHLAPFLLTHLVLDLIQKSSQGRIVNLTAGMPASRHGFLDNLQGERSYGQFAAYRSSKIGNILFTYELARRLEGTGITVNCVHPGPVKTEFTRKAGGFLGTISKFLRPIMKSPDAGARGPIYLATSPEVACVTGAYFVSCKQKRSAAMTYDRELAVKHWEISRRLTGLRDG